MAKVPGYKRFSQKEMEQLRTQMYSGFLTKSVPRYEWRGAGKDGRSYRQTGYRNVTNYDAYNDGLLGRARDAVGIKNVNNADEIRRIYDYIGGYQAPAPAAPKAAPAPVKATPASSKPTNQYQSQIASLTASIKKQQKENARAQAAAQAAADKRAAAARKAAQKDYQSQLSAMQNLYASNLQSTKDKFGLQISGLQQSITDQAADFKAQQQTMATNQERARLAGATPELKLQQSADQKIGGTTTFKKRLGTQYNAPFYGSLATIKSGTLNI
ncbi:hypothetical protein PQZ37_00715 [bacterium]|nr:hypothetical protein [bacterium]